MFVHAAESVRKPRRGAVVGIHVPAGGLLAIATFHQLHHARLVKHRATQPPAQGPPHIPRLSRPDGQGRVRPAQKAEYSVYVGRSGARVPHFRSLVKRHANPALPPNRRRISRGNTDNTAPDDSNLPPPDVRVRRVQSSSLSTHHHVFLLFCSSALAVSSLS